MNVERRITAVCLTILLALSSGALAESYVFPVEPAALTENDISVESAIDAAKGELTRRRNLSDFEKYRIKAGCVKLENGEKAWVVMLDELQCGTDALVTLSAADGRLIDYQETDREIISLLVETWTSKKGGMRTWTLEDKALFNWLFGMDDAYVVPSEGHISQERAGEIALAAIPEKASPEECSYAFRLFSYTDGRPKQYVWLITITKNGEEKYLVHVSADNGDVLEVFALDGNG